MSASLSHVVFREIAHRSAEYEATIELRDQLLRAPLGLGFGASEISEERADTHLAGFDKGGSLLACLVLSQLDTNSTMRMRQVAVAPNCQGQGIGSQLVSFAESVARRRRSTLMTLHARINVLGFYKRLGYTQIGGEFLEVGIPHIGMEKQL